jgi:hypothetical protein
MYARGAEMIRELTGFREANVVPIKAFFHTQGGGGGDQRINYFGKLTTDESPLVRAAFYGMLAAWWIDLPERLDYGAWRAVAVKTFRGWFGFYI